MELNKKQLELLEALIGHMSRYEMLEQLARTYDNEEEKASEVMMLFARIYDYNHKGQS